MGDNAKRDRYNIGGTERTKGETVEPADDGSQPESDSSGQNREQRDTESSEDETETQSGHDGARLDTEKTRSDSNARATGSRPGQGDQSKSTVDSGREQIGFSTEYDTLPHRVRTNSPSEERSQIDMKVGPEEQQHLSRLQEIATREFDEKVYLTDVKLAAMIAGLKSSDEAFLQEMRQIGYGYLD
jgi:hypothetical protein